MAMKAKKTAKQGTAKAASRSGKPKPTFLRGTKSVDIPVHRVSDVIAMIHEHGHSAKFKRQAKAAGVSMSLDPKTVNFVKDFVAKNDMHEHAIGSQVVNSDGSFDCTNS
jgi:hypothetical protein